MNKTFLQSVAVGILSVSLAASCAKKSSSESHACGAKNGCAAKNTSIENKAADTKVKRAKRAKKAKKQEAAAEVVAPVAPASK